MTSDIRLALLAPIVGAAWVSSAMVAHAQPAPAEPAVAAASRGADSAPQQARPVGLVAQATEPPAAPAAPAYPNVHIMTVQPVDADNWRVTAAPYLWMAGIKSSMSFSPHIGSASTIDADVDVRFSELLQRLHVGFMGAAEARRGKVSVQTDVIYMSLSQGGSRVRDVTGPLGREVPVELGSNLKLKATIWTLSGGYDVFRNDRSFVQLFAGFRYLGANTSLDWNFQGPLAALPRTGAVSANSGIWNGVGGVHGEVAVADSRWKLVYYGDAGTGASKLTWQASGQLAYAWRWGDVGLGWRYLDYRADSGNAIQSLRMSGPIVIAHYRF